MNRYHLYLLLLNTLMTTLSATAQQPVNLQTTKARTLVNRSSTPTSTQDALRLEARPGDGMLVLDDIDLADGTIDLDIKGSHLMQQSFVGLAFHIQDTTHFEAVYFRPFNFKSTDPVRASHAVQYISMPDNDWQKLRTQFPGKYEHAATPAPDPDEWFHATIVLKGRHVAVYVNRAKEPSLRIIRLAPSNHGHLGLWTGNDSPGDFAHLIISPKH